MAHGYRTLQHWNQWLSQQYLGSCLLDAEQQCLAPLLADHYGKHALLVGVPQQSQLLNATAIAKHTILSPLVHKHDNFAYIEGDFHEIPILTGSIDLVLLPHTLELIDNPRQLLAEACRIVKPEGLIAITGFNPYSMWGLRQTLSHDNQVPWSNNFIQAHQVKSWLALADFEMEQRKSILFRPPLAHKNTFKKLRFLENIGNMLLPVFGGVYVLVARAKVIPLTPIKLKWKQQLGSIRISSTMSGHIVSQSK